MDCPICKDKKEQGILIPQAAESEFSAVNGGNKVWACHKDPEHRFWQGARDQPFMYHQYKFASDDSTEVDQEWMIIKGEWTRRKD